LTDPPKGRVVITVDKDNVIVKIESYVEKEKFTKILALLKEHFFKYDPNKKV
jgi:hypothetical protein